LVIEEDFKFIVNKKLATGFEYINLQ